MLMFAGFSINAKTKVESSVPYRIKDGTIVLKEPARQKGQESALLMATDPIDTVRIGFIGMGARGYGAIYRYSFMPGIRIVAMCDLFEEKIEKCQNFLEAKGIPRAEAYVGEEAWKEVCQRDDIDLIYITTGWQLHTPIAIYAMQHGKHVAIEVPAATSLAECWQLVDVSEQTRKHCMMLENCCYDAFELTALNMAKKGLFGTITHCQGGYVHNLDAIWPKYTRNWRLEFNQKFRGDNYPTHGLGPLCQLLDIHRGNRMKTLVSMDSDPFHSAEMGKKFMDADEFADGDHTVSLIRTESGSIIEIHHNVYAGRPYDRLYQITGTDGFATKYPKQGFAFNGGTLKEDNHPELFELQSESFVSDSTFNALIAEYQHPVVKEVMELAKKVGGHGGMDFIMDYRMIYCLRNGLPLDMDVYDAAEWCSISELSRLSILNGNMPVAVPDFTRGDWNKIQGYKHTGFDF